MSNGPCKPQSHEWRNVEYIWVEENSPGVFCVAQEPPTEAAAAEMVRVIEDDRQRKRQDLFNGLSGLPRKDGLEEHVDRFYDALGLPTAPGICVDGSGDLPSNVFNDSFIQQPTLAGKNFPYPQAVVVVERPEFNYPPDWHRSCLTHEKGHSTGRYALYVDKDLGINNMGNAALGFITWDVNEEERRGPFLEESVEVFAGVYGDLFLEHNAEPMDLGGIPMPSKYCYGDNISGSVFPALTVEAMTDRDPGLFDAFVSARRSQKGLDEFKQRVERLSPGLYRALENIGQDRFEEGLRETVERIHPDGTRIEDIASRLGAFMRQVVWGKLKAYEERTGYNFGLPDLSASRFVKPTKIAVNGLAGVSRSVAPPSGSILQLQQELHDILRTLPCDGELQETVDALTRSISNIFALYFGVETPQTNSICSIIEQSINYMEQGRDCLYAARLALSDYSDSLG